MLLVKVGEPRRKMSGARAATRVSGTLGRPAIGTRALRLLLVGGVAVLAVAAGHSALAEPLRQGSASSERYQIYLDSVETSAPRGDWGSLRLSGPEDQGGVGLLRNPAAGGTGPYSLNYFTPSLSGFRLGFGATPRQSAGRELGGFGPEGEATVTPRFGGMRGRPQGRQFGGTLAYSGGLSGVEIGANFGDGPNPACQEAANCQAQDFWDIGISFRLGGGAVSAGYLGSQQRGFRRSEGETDMFSLNAGYRLAPGVDIYGGVDWIDFSRTDGADEPQRNTRFMFGTNLRF